MLHPRQQALLNFIYNYHLARGFSPSVREMVAGCGVSSTSVVSHHLRALELGGYLERQPERARALRLTAQGKAAAVLPEGGPDATTRSHTDGQHGRAAL